MTDLTDQLDAAERRYDISQAVLSHGSSSTISQLYRLGESANDVPFLLDLARKQQATIDAVREVHDRITINQGYPSERKACLSDLEDWPCPTIEALEVKP